MKILTAEDEATVRLVIVSLLKKWGHEVTEVDNGADALNLLQAEEAPEITILDRMMPKMNGDEVCRKVRQLDRTNPTYIIMLTAMGRKEDIVDGLTAGADDYLCKPFDIEELKARIDVGCRIVTMHKTQVERTRELQEALDHVKVLQGTLPICMHCHKIKSKDDQVWQRLEHYISEHSEAEFSHGICDHCIRDKYPEVLEWRKKKQSGL